MVDPAELPETYRQIVTRFPKLAEAWDLTAAAGADGPLDERTRRLVKLGMAMAAMREGAVHSGVRKAVAAGASRAEVEQLVVLVAGTIGFAGAAAVYTWVRDVLGEAPGPTAP
ncbi:MAG TPA: carboxymuconolactone decarboxylase family protein [Polyangia bacterium]|jgi:alkylhydroperoxidase/carboxymuconolactone decarboxylase family protein YurZ